MQVSPAPTLTQQAPPCRPGRQSERLGGLGLVPDWMTEQSPKTLRLSQHPQQHPATGTKPRRKVPQGGDTGNPKKSPRRGAQRTEQKLMGGHAYRSYISPPPRRRSGVLNLSEEGREIGVTPLLYRWGVPKIPLPCLTATCPGFAPTPRPSLKRQGLKGLAWVEVRGAESLSGLGGDGEPQVPSRMQPASPGSGGGYLGPRLRPSLQRAAAGGRGGGAGAAGLQVSEGWLALARV